jgi:peptide/nickel transport system substrate-binding protein
MGEVRGMRLLAALAAVCAILATTGCGSAAAPDRLTIALAEDPDELDPTLSSTFVARIVFAHMCEKLYDVDANLKVVPQLAAGPPRVSGDGRTVTIDLRRGVRFNDGTRFDAAAVKRSLDRHRTQKDSSRSGELEPVRSVEVVDGDTVRLRLTQRFVPLTSLLADRAGMIMSPRALDELGDKFATGPVCVGPYSYKERVASDRIVLERSDVYYDRPRIPTRELVFRIITEGPVRASNLRSGDVDIAERLDPVDVVSIRGDDSIRLTERTSIGYQGITLNLGNVKGTGEPFRTRDTPLARDARLREAFDLSLDREVISKVVFFDEVVPGCSAVSPVSGLEPGLRCPGRDLARAKRLVEESGVKTPVRVPLLVEAQSQTIRLGEVIQAMAREAGFDVRLQPTEFTTALDRADAGDYEAIQVGWSGRVDPDGNLFNHQATSGPLNYAGSSDAAIDRELDQAREEADPERRREEYRDLLDRLRKRRSTIVLYHDRLVTGARQDVAGLEMRGDGLPRLNHARRTED